MSSVPRMLALLLMLGALVATSSVADALTTEEAEYIRQVNLTIQSMTTPPETVSAQALPCHGLVFDTPDRDCKFDYKGKATSVHLLTPKDIGVVAALGDSITAGFGARATGIFDFFVESRGVSWSIGGDESSYEMCGTIPNVLRYFNEDVKGEAHGTGKTDKGLDVAVSGAKADGIMAQAIELVETVNENGWQDEWKLVTLWIGGNDLCQQCLNGKFSPENYHRNLRETLVYLKDNMPKTLVNLPLIIDVTKLGETAGLVCGAIHLVACACAQTAILREITILRRLDYMYYQQMLEDDAELNDGDDFAVVVQPFFEDLTVPVKENGDVDMDFFAPDCFHMSTMGHRAFAASLWNNMLQSDKNLDWDPYSPLIECPSSDHPYFFTKRTQAKMDAMAAARDNQQGGVFNAESVPGDQDGGGGETDENSGQSLGQIVGLTVGGTGVACLALVVVGVVIGGVVWMKRHRRGATEAIPLITKL